METQHGFPLAAVVRLWLGEVLFASVRPFSWFRTSGFVTIRAARSLNLPVSIGEQFRHLVTKFVLVNDSCDFFVK